MDTNSPAESLPTVPSTVVIVDDHPLIRDSLRLLLDREPTLKVVGVCSDCASAWDLIQALRPNLALVDVDLPDGSGLALAARLRAADAAIKLLILTGNMQQDLAAKAKAAGADGFVLKLSSPETIVAVVHGILAGNVVVHDAPPAPSLAAPVLSTPTDPAATTAPLPARESQVLALVVRGLRNKEIAAELGLNVKTIETYRSRLMKRFNCNSPAELVRHAIRLGLVAP